MRGTPEETARLIAQGKRLPEAGGAWRGAVRSIFLPTERRVASPRSRCRRYRTSTTIPSVRTGAVFVKSRTQQTEPWPPQSWIQSPQNECVVPARAQLAAGDDEVSRVVMAPQTPCGSQRRAL